jgi:hypothetical protein
MVTPLLTVLGAIDAGETTRRGIVRRTGLDPDVVDAAVEHLVRTGRVGSPALRTGCPTGGCGGCGSGCATDALIQIASVR